MSPFTKVIVDQIARGLDAIPDPTERRLALLETLMQLNAVATRVGIPRETLIQASAHGRKAGLPS